VELRVSYCQIYFHNFWSFWSDEPGQVVRIILIDFGKVFERIFFTILSIGTIDSNFLNLSGILQDSDSTLLGLIVTDSKGVSVSTIS
jgi:hypothetical protein